MQHPDRENVSRLEELPNIGKAMAADLRLIGIEHPKQLIGQNAFTMYEQLCAETDQSQDPCVIDVFMAVVHFMETGDPLPWWAFTKKRKSMIVHKK
jgi:hypothetical protein